MHVSYQKVTTEMIRSIAVQIYYRTSGRDRRLMASRGACTVGAGGSYPERSESGCALSGFSWRYRARSRILDRR